MQFALIVVRALHFWAVALLLGGGGLLLTLGRRDAAARVALRIAAAGAAVTGAAWFAIVFVTTTDDPTALLDAEAWSAFLSAPFGVPWLVRLGLCALALAIAWRGTPALCLALGGAFAVDQAWLGHAANGSSAAAATQLLSYWLHVVAGFAWVGALAMLCILSASERRIPRDGLNLFSLVGTFVVAAILASGIANAALRGLNAADLATPYGRIVLVKLGLFAAMVALATFNRLRSRSADAGAFLRWSLASEMGLGLAVLAVAAVLGITPPP